MIELTPIEQITRDTIDEISSIKRDGGVSPDFATLTEIENTFKIVIKEAINSLYRKGRLEWHKTVNGIPMFGVKK